ncbi:MAG: hypothetical protein JW811_06265 [Clostridiales bacterium]|nr:hypothetical protein [Clostridiales bacterium]
MKYHRFVCIACTLVFLLACTLPAAAGAGAQPSCDIPMENTQWTSYTNANWINDIAFDQNGYLWAATSGGAVRWDVGAGTYMKYTSEYGLCSNQLSAIAVAPDGAIWFASKDNGISKLKDCAFTNYTVSDGMPSNVVNDLSVAPDGTVWVATDWDICSFDGQSWTTYRDTPIKQMETNADFIVADPDGNIWCGAHFYGVFRLSEAGWTHYDEPEDISSMVYSMALGADGSVWASMMDASLVHYGGGKAEIVQLDTGGMPYIKCICVQEDGAMWFMNWSDVICVKGGQWETFYNDYGVTIDTTCIIEGPDGTIWCGGFMGGLAGYKDGEWTVLQTDDWLPDNTVSKIVADETGGHWILSATAITYFDGETAQVYPTNWKAMDLLIAPDGGVWASLGKNGVYRFNGTQWVFYGPGDTQDGFLDNSPGAFLGELESILGEEFDFMFGEEGAAFGGDFFGDFDEGGEAVLVEPTQMGPGIETDPWYTSIEMTPDGRLLCVSVMETVHSLYDGKWSVYQAQSDSVSDVLISQQGAYWISCSEGLYRSTDGRNYTFYPEIIDPDNRIYHFGSLYVTPDEVCWIASLSGVGCQPAGGDSFCFRKGDGIPEENVACVTGAPDGTIWIGTSYMMTSESGAGACRYDGGAWQTITASDGLASNAVHDICAGTEAIWYGTHGGISVYRPH